MTCTLSDLSPAYCAHCRGEHLDPSVPVQVDTWGRALAVQRLWETIPLVLFQRRPFPATASECEVCGRRITTGDVMTTRDGGTFCGPCTR